jgi:lipopolysaccharide export system permease protein
MRLPYTLSLYIGRRFLLSIGTILLGMMLLVFFMDFIELLRRASEVSGVGFGVALEMALLKAPHMLEQALPFAVLLGGIHALTRLTRTQELVIARASGISVWQFLTPGLLLVLLIGMLVLAVFNPIASAMFARYEKLEGRFLEGRTSLLTVSSSGLWLREIEPESGTVHIILANHVQSGDMVLKQVTFYNYEPDGTFRDRYDAAKAELGKGSWTLTDVLINAPGQPARREESMRLPTTLTLNQIQDSFASPETMSFWELPPFIHTLQQAGFSALRHRLHWHALLSSPLLLCAMILIAAIFSLRLPRRGRIGLSIVAGIVTGFVIYFSRELVYSVGLSGGLPLQLAAWAPASVALLAGIVFLLHLEDG